MENRNLELKDICGYLPYGLEFLYIDGRSIYPLWCLFPNVNNNFTNERIIWEITHNQFKPILRPLSDLYKKITHNGKEIIPIVECAKITFGEFEFWLGENSMENPCAIVITDELDEFGYNENINLYYSQEFGFITDSTEFLMKNQIQLFDYLNELKIDYRGLIDAGLAIDCNALKDNPYK
ncbi:hypothetical protein FACS189434_09250 [Bacteroidia bacterium]|nr:hypothetical protein FACS189434_09250 [Bacteroidia bacterium]